MKKSTLFFLLIACIAFGCKKPLSETVKEEFPDGTPKLVISYKGEGSEKVKHAVREYYPNGQVKYSGTFNNKGQREGKWSYWYKDGKLWSECEYEDGAKHGSNKTWHPNGQRRYIGKYNNDQRTGTWKFWDKNGKLTKEVEF